MPLCLNFHIHKITGNSIYRQVLGKLKFHADHLAQYLYMISIQIQLFLLLLLLYSFFIFHGQRNVQKWKGFPVIHCGPPALECKNRSCCFRSKSKGKNKTTLMYLVNDIRIQKTTKFNSELKKKSPNNNKIISNQHKKQLLTMSGVFLEGAVEYGADGDRNRQEERV